MGNVPWQDVDDPLQLVDGGTKIWHRQAIAVGRGSIVEYGVDLILELLLDLRVTDEVDDGPTDRVYDLSEHLSQQLAFPFTVSSPAVHISPASRTSVSLLKPSGWLKLALRAAPTIACRRIRRASRANMRR